MSSRNCATVVLNYNTEHKVSIHEGHALSHVVLSLDGRDLAKHLTKLFTK